jgi:glycosyltransferase involved in cell wall biosynthesis
MRLVVVTQRVDGDDPALGATVGKLRALASCVDEVVVLALSAVPVSLPPNVSVRTFGGRTRLGRVLRLELELVRAVRGQDVAVLAHMSPVYAILAAPVVRTRRAPLLLWFTHWRDSRMLRLAERVATGVVSVNRTSFPFASRKLVAVGHGIEVDDLSAPDEGHDTLRVLAVGRTSPAKGLETIVDAVAELADPTIELRIVGPSLTGAEVEHRDALRARGARVDPPVARSEIAAVYASADVLVNNMRAGALDKVVYEAAAAGLAVLVASEGFDELVEGIDPPLRFKQDDATSLAARIAALAALPQEQLHAIGAELRSRVARDHSVERWAEAIAAAAR